MRLSDRIAEAGLRDDVAVAFVSGLREVACIDGPETDLEHQLIGRLVDILWTEGIAPAPFEALWSCAELFLTACVYVAVAEGKYGVEEARLISLFAHRLGYSARRLSALEDRVFAELSARGAATRTIPSAAATHQAQRSSQPSADPWQGLGEITADITEPLDRP